MTVQDWTTQDLGTFEIGKRTFRVEIQTLANGNEMIWLYGARGATYWLREVSNKPGLYRIVSWKSGQEMRNKTGRSVEVFAVGDMFEEVTYNPAKDA